MITLKLNKLSHGVARYAAMSMINKENIKDFKRLNEEGKKEYREAFDGIIYSYLLNPFSNSHSYILRDIIYYRGQLEKNCNYPEWFNSPDANKLFIKIIESEDIEIFNKLKYLSSYVNSSYSQINKSMLSHTIKNMIDSEGKFKATEPIELLFEKCIEEKLIPESIPDLDIVNKFSLLLFLSEISHDKKFIIGNLLSELTDTGISLDKMRNFFFRQNNYNKIKYTNHNDMENLFNHEDPYYSGYYYAPNTSISNILSTGILENILGDKTVEFINYFIENNCEKLCKTTMHYFKLLISIKTLESVIHKDNPEEKDDIEVVKNTIKEKFKTKTLELAKHSDYVYIGTKLWKDQFGEDEYYKWMTEIMDESKYKLWLLKQRLS